MFRRKTTVRRVRRLAAAAILAFGTAAFAGPAARFDIPAQPMSSALRALASQAGVQLVFAPEVVAAIAGASIKGAMDVETALGKLLAGSGLEFRREGERSYVVVKSASAAKDRTLSEMVVTATRTERRIEDVPASVSVVTAKELGRLQFVKVQDALKHVEGIDFNESAAAGGAADARIRGIGGSFAGATSVTLVDGMATDSYISGVLGRGGLNFLAAQDIERIEVLRGPASALYGPNVVGGVINVIPKRWRGAPGAEVNADIGTHDSRNAGAAVGAAGDNFDVRLSATEFRTGGYIAQPVADPAGDKDLAPRDWKDSKWSLNGAVYPSADQEISFGYQQYRVDTALMGGRPNYRQNHNGDAYTLGYRKDLAGGGSFKLSYRNNSLRQDMRNDDQAWNGTMDSYVLAGTFYRHSDTDSIDAQATVPLSDDNTLTYGASYLTTRYETGWDDLLFGGNSRSRSSAEAAAVFIQDEHRFGDLALTVGGRNDRIRQGSSFTNGTALNGGAVEETFNPRLGLRYRLSPATSFYASVGTAFVPASADLKFPGNPVNWQNNPGLKPETSTTHEVGVNQRLTWGTWHAALYHTDYKDQISSVSVGGTPWPKKYVNIGKVTVDGLEVGLQGELAGGWKPYINYAYTDSVIKENPTDPLTVGKHTQRVAPQKVNLGVLYAPGDAWSLCLAGRYVDERYFTDRNTPDHRAPSYFVADAKLTVRLPAVGAGKWDAYLAVNNLFNEKYTVWEYENADRLNVWFGVNGKF